MVTARTMVLVMGTSMENAFDGGGAEMMPSLAC